MIVYASREHRTVPHAALDALAAELARFPADAEGAHAAARELLVRCGEIEAAVVDAGDAERDEVTPSATALREASLALGRLFRATWSGDAEARRAAVTEAEARLAAARETVPGGEVAARVPEGYAYYALYPEMYLAAAERFHDQVRPTRAVVVGVRSIGTSLSAAVAAGLEGRGCAVRSCTVRPRGHPWDRRVTLGPRLAAWLREWRDAWFVVADEGPGISGTSFCGTAEALVELGVPEERIVFFPSWEPDVAALVSERARTRWGRHRVVTVPFEAVWTDSGRLGKGIVDGDLRDVAAGAWRRLFWASEAEWPAVQPRHERRKYLAEPSAAWRRRHGRTGALLLKFAGVGGLGRPRLERAEALAALGFGPPAHGLADGFLVHSFVDGQPLSASDLDAGLIDRMGGYAAALAREFPTGEGVDFDALLEMVTVNAREGLGDAWAARAEALERHRPVVADAGTVGVDGRMLPHEWLRTADGYLKTDGVDHHDDHFFPGCQDPAWDLAGAVAEFGMGRDAARRLVRRYVEASGDRGVARRLPFHRAAYLAYRLGYVTMGATALGGDADAERLRAQGRRYAAALRRALAAGARAGAAG